MNNPVDESGEGAGFGMTADTITAIKKALVGVALESWVGDKHGDVNNLDGDFQAFCGGTNKGKRARYIAAVNPEAISELLYTLESLQRENEELLAENGELRNIVSNCAAALLTGAFVSPKCSVGFMKDVPKEIASTVGSLRHRAEAAEADISLIKGPLKWYGEQARLARLIHSEGDKGRNALVHDGGTLARDVLSTEPQPASSVSVKALQWDEDGDNLKARMGDREWMLNITADGKTWAGATRPFVFGKNLTWSSVPNCSFLPLDVAKSVCQADCQSRYDALHSTKALDADDVINELSAMPCETEGFADLEAGCCRTCRARFIRAALSSTGDTHGN